MSGFKEPETGKEGKYNDTKAKKIAGKRDFAKDGEGNQSGQIFTDLSGFCPGGRKYPGGNPYDARTIPVLDGSTAI